jgi:hypothetical protein
MVKLPRWAAQFITVNFYMDESTTRENGYGPKTNQWMRDSKAWLRSYLVEYFQVNKEDIIINPGFYEWSSFAKIYDQWWYFSTGDIRFKVFPSFLVRTAQHPKDYTGGFNQYVKYNDPDFTQALTRILSRRMTKPEAETFSLGYMEAVKESRK